MSAPAPKAATRLRRRPDPSELSLARLQKTLRDLMATEPDRNRFRGQAIDHLKGVLGHERALINAALRAGDKGTSTAKRLCALNDRILLGAFDCARHLVDDKSGVLARSVTLIAVGGYGRGTIAPFSDVDLLFLVPKADDPASQTFMRSFLPLLWDIGLKVGHATRTRSEAIALAREDMTIRTTLLERRFLRGDTAAFDRFVTRFRQVILGDFQRGFIEAKLAEREMRHARTGDSRYQVEPNIKEGKGGFRDLHSLFWILASLYPDARARDLVREGVLTHDDVHRFRRAADFLWTVRAHMHFLSEGPQERLDFSLQRQIAAFGTYRGKEGMKAVERFMRRYFFNAREVGHLTRVLCTSLELSTPQTSWRLPRLFNQRDRDVNGFPDLCLRQDRLMPREEVLERATNADLLAPFSAAQVTDHAIHPDALRWIGVARKRRKLAFRNDPDALALFLSILCHEKDPGSTLRLLNETGLLGDLLPAFGKIVAMMQFSLYHHYTVDEHLLIAMKVLRRLERGELVDDFPLVSRLIRGIRHRRALHVAVLLHDVAKGRKEDHSIAGARVVKRLGPKLGLSAAETETAAWLVRHHLLMSDIAQTRDLADDRTARDFAHEVQTIERLNLLLILTVCDMHAVGPGVCSAWKRQLLRTLYFQTEPLLSGGFSFLSNAGATAPFAHEMHSRGWDQDAIDTHIARHYRPYWRRATLARQVAQAELLRTCRRDGQKLCASFNTDTSTGFTEINFATEDRPGLLSLIAGGLASAGASIVEAQTSQTRDGMAADAVTLGRTLREDADENKRIERLIARVEQVIGGDFPLQEHSFRSKRMAKSKLFPVTAEVMLNNCFSDRFTVIEVKGQDRMGLLYDLVRELESHHFLLASAHVTTYGERAIDVFYVTDRAHQKITDPAEQKRIEDKLMEVLS